ncbi:DUF2059 domain-containing protein [Sandarakinorhabdus sp.]|uniref:DUF2059 domain-containing protein n=1 Tax=Sandarakinorhabdus sp. TaxID=1916663 RepID=UPI00333FF29C
MSFLIAAVAVVGAAAAPPQQARPGVAAPPAVRADAATLQAAAALVAQLGLKSQLQTQMASTVKQMRSGFVVRAMLAQQPGFVPAYQANKAKFDVALQKAGAIQADIAQTVINQNIGSVVTAARDAYARQYTAAELNGLAAFYRSPLGVALQKKQGAVQNEIGQQTARLIGTKIDMAMQANAAKLREALAPLGSATPPPRK